MFEIALATSIFSLGLAAAALQRIRTLRAALETERAERSSSAESWEAESRLMAGRIDAIEQRIGRARRLTSAKRDRALELLAHGATERAIARELQMREAEVAVLARLRNSVAN